MFNAWSQPYSQVEMVCDGTSCADDRIGAVAAIQLAVEEFKITDDLIIIGG